MKPVNLEFSPFNTKTVTLTIPVKSCVHPLAVKYYKLSRDSSLKVTWRKNILLHDVVPR